MGNRFTRGTAAAQEDRDKNNKLSEGS